ncbi:hypothetical protein SAMN05421793_15116 [Epilithonimonas hominis]|uniref:Uncharacterized protein n=1 Tax=Epilithonimonas hominis TaxID=420404 RepID=A0A1H6M301_9FLAO|nr:hypothetical protein SAMN05421793_15116 [Epilithonimonas hominis]
MNRFLCLNKDKDAELMKKLKEQETREKQKLNHYNNAVEL